MFLTIVIFILVLTILVSAHEFGHFFTARRFGVRAEEFGFGFPPRAIGWYKNKKGLWRHVLSKEDIDSLSADKDSDRHPAPLATIYSINWLPIGGFVKIKGEDGDDKDQRDSFGAQKIWRRVIILSAGVIMNVFLAWLLFSLGYLFGMPQSTDTLGSQAIVEEAQVVVSQVIPESIAARAGLQDGDAILRINNITIDTEKTLQDAIAAQADQEISITIERNGEVRELKAVPHAQNGGRATIGVSIFSAGLVRYPFFPALWEGLKTTFWILKEIFVSLYNLVGQVFHGQDVGSQFAGPVGIANITGQAARLGFTYLLQFMALLSLNLAVINILPFPALDGGRIIFLLVEKLKGRPVRKEVEALIHNIGFLLLISLVVFITFKDIIRLF